jgi:hypothetical protein
MLCQNGDTGFIELEFDPNFRMEGNICTGPLSRLFYRLHYVKCQELHQKGDLMWSTLFRDSTLIWFRWIDVLWLVEKYHIIWGFTKGESMGYAWGGLGHM